MVDARRVVGAVVLMSTLALTGCTPDGPAGPTPSLSSAAPTPLETTQERQERLDYAAAEKSYRTFRAEYERVLRAGGAKDATATMKNTAGGGYLKTFTEVVQAFSANGSRDTGRETIAYVRPSGYASDSLALEVCEDSRSVVTIRRSGHRSRGEVRQATIEVRKVSNVWKVWSGTGKLDDSCD